MTAVPYNAMRGKALRLCERKLVEKLPDVADGGTNWRQRGVLLIEAGVTASRASDILTIDQQNNVRRLGLCSSLTSAVLSTPPTWS